jgi:YbbR domain-containing protein
VRVRAALLDNWPLKLTSLALSILLWLVASAEEPASGLLQVVVQVQPPNGRVVVSAPEHLRATIVGPRRDLLKLSAEPLILTRLLPDSLTADSVQLDFAPLDLVLPHGVTARVQDIEPRRMMVELDPVTQRIVPVRPVVLVAPDSGFELQGGIAVAPGQVRVVGPRDAVAGIDSVATVPLSIRRADGPSQQRIAIDTARLGAVRVVPSRVTVSVNVQATGERMLTNVPVQLASASLGGWRPDPDAVTVRVHGPRARLGTLTVDSIVVILERPATAGSRAALRVHVPGGLHGDVIPDSVTLVRRGERG